MTTTTMQNHPTAADAPRTVVRMANLVIGGAASMCALVSLGARLIGRTGAYWIAPLGLCILLLACLRLRPTRRIGAALCCLSAVFALYAAELYFTLVSGPRSFGQFPKSPGSFDARSALQVVADLRSQGVSAHANLAGRLLMASGKNSLASESGAILPIGGMSGEQVVFCNESGRYVTYRSDERGFNNPAGIWSHAPAAIAALGDSFAQGFCVAPERSFVSLIRSRFPATLNLGMVGEGPLFELATLREYLPSAKPKTVLWFYFEANDLDDLGSEARDPMLRRYLEQEGFRQHLAERQPEIDRAWTGFEAGLVSDWERSRAPRWLRPLADWLTDLTVEHKNRSTLARILRLREVRGRLAAPFAAGRDEQSQLPLLRQVLARANAEVASWGGAVHFVFLPGMDLLMRPAGPRARLAQSVLAQVRSLGIPVIDLRDAFHQHEIASLFYYPDSHYNELGARLVADAVLSSLSAEVSAVRSEHQEH